MRVTETGVEGVGNGLEQVVAAPGAAGRPGGWLRFLARVCRSIPPGRGRLRLEKLLHRRLANHGWCEVLRVNGCAMRLSLDGLIGRTIYVEGELERENTALVKYLIQPGDIIFDGGANEGYFGLLFSQLAGPQGRVYAFEPVARTVQLLRANLALNPQPAATIVVEEIALSEGDGTVTMNLAGAANYGQSHVAPAADAPPRATPVPIDGQADVRCRALDSFWRELGKPAVRVVKLDVEAHELQALAGAEEMLAELPGLIVLVEVKFELLATVRRTPADVFQFFKSRGYHAFEFDPRRESFALNDTPRTAELIVFSRGTPRPAEGIK